MTRLVAAISLIAALAAPSFSQPIGQADLIQRMTDLDRLTRPPPAGERTLLFSSFDRASREVQAGRHTQWDANNDRNQFLSKSSDGWDVWASVEGPSAITRIWCDKLAGEMQIIIDGKTAASGKLADFFSGAIEPFGEPLTYTVGSAGNPAGVSYFPIGASRSLAIRTRGFDGAYQVDAIAFAASTPVSPFQAQLDAEAMKAIESLGTAYKNGLTEKQLFARAPRPAETEPDAEKAAPRARIASHAVQEDLKPKQKLTIEIPPPPKPDGKAPKSPTGGTIRALYIAITDKFEPRDKYALHNLALRVRCDGAAQPQVEAPLVAFFGTGYQRNRFNSLIIGTDRLVTDFPSEHSNESIFMYCFFAMPFHKAVQIEVENMNATLKTPIGVMVLAKVDTAPPPADALHFHARFRIENPCKSFDYPLLDATGRGRVVGCVLNIDTPRQEWWGEGDHKAWLDGEAFPSIYGTGTADFFGNIAPLARFVRPMHGTTLTSTVGKNSCFRFCTLDAIAFQKSIRLAIENWQPAKAQDVTYGSVTYWYADSAATVANFDRLAAEDLKLPGLRIPGSVEIEGNIEGKGWGTVVKQRDAGVELSGEAAATISTTDPIVTVVKVAAAGKYELKLRVVPGFSFDSITVTGPADKPVGEVKYDRKSGSVYTVGTVELAAGENRLTVTCKTKPTKLDCWILEPVK